jgi:hypothetical protein
MHTLASLRRQGCQIALPEQGATEFPSFKGGHCKD